MKNPLPSHRFLITNKITNWLAAIFVVLLALFILSTYAITYSIERDCTNTYKRDTGFARYWVHVEIGSKKDGCPNYGSR